MITATYQQTKREVDPVAGTYQTVLTIDQTLSQSVIVGTYNSAQWRMKEESLLRQWLYQVRLNSCTLSSFNKGNKLVLRNGVANHMD